MEEVKRVSSLILYGNIKIFKLNFQINFIKGYDLICKIIFFHITDYTYSDIIIY